jgi:hypothetical protein
MNVGAEELRAILQAYKQVADASWPELHPAMAGNAASWPRAAAPELQQELDGYLRESAQRSQVRVFYKLGAGLEFAGCNDHFAKDAGLSRQALIGLDDFSPQLPWAAQAAKYRADDKEIVDSGKPQLDILERQTNSSGAISWIRVGKTPVRGATGVIGLLGMYESLDDKTAQRLYLERSRAGGR